MWNRYAAVNEEFVPLSTWTTTPWTACRERRRVRHGHHLQFFFYLHAMLRQWIDDDGRIVTVDMRLKNPLLRGRTLEAGGEVTRRCGRSTTRCSSTSRSGRSTTRARPWEPAPRPWRSPCRIDDDDPRRCTNPSSTSLRPCPACSRGRLCATAIRSRLSPRPTGSRTGRPTRVRASSAKRLLAAGVGKGTSSTPRGVERDAGRSREGESRLSATQLQLASADQRRAGLTTPVRY